MAIGGASRGGAHGDQPWVLQLWSTMNFRKDVWASAVLLLVAACTAIGLAFAVLAYNSASARIVPVTTQASFVSIGPAFVTYTLTYDGIRVDAKRTLRNHPRLAEADFATHNDTEYFGVSVRDGKCWYVATPEGSPSDVKVDPRHLEHAVSAALSPSGRYLALHIVRSYGGERISECSVLKVQGDSLVYESTFPMLLTSPLEFTRSDSLHYFSQDGSTYSWTKARGQILLFPGRHVIPSPDERYLCEIGKTQFTIYERSWSPILTYGGLMLSIQHFGWTQNSEYFVADTESNPITEYASQCVLVDIVRRKACVFDLEHKAKGMIWLK